MTREPNLNLTVGTDLLIINGRTKTQSLQQMLAVIRPRTIWSTWPYRENWNPLLTELRILAVMQNVQNMQTFLHTLHILHGLFNKSKFMIWFCSFAANFLFPSGLNLAKQILPFWFLWISIVSPLLGQRKNGMEVCNKNKSQFHDVFYRFIS